MERAEGMTGGESGEPRGERTDGWGGEEDGSEGREEAEEDGLRGRRGGAWLLGIPGRKRSCPPSKSPQGQETPPPSVHPGDP